MVSKHFTVLSLCPDPVVPEGGARRSDNLHVAQHPLVSTLFRNLLSCSLKALFIYELPMDRLSLAIISPVTALYCQTLFIYM